ncbi:MAG: hypothetical protein AVW06_02930 [Hadesarchaea archaeon DG-33-1]|nr:MAG: hypothetical protein AVW06_02930 [Hadesarchaea archaeon DG-33-1]
MIGFKCRDCGRMTYQTRARCPNCKGKNFEEVELGDECKLLTYTKLYVLPEGVETSSLLLGMVEFPNGVRASGQLIGDHIKVGMKLRPRWGKLRKLGGKDIYGFKFEPIGE